MRWQNAEGHYVHSSYIKKIKWQWHLHHPQFQYHMASDESELEYIQVIKQSHDIHVTSCAYL